MEVKKEEEIEIDYVTIKQQCINLKKDSLVGVILVAKRFRDHDGYIAIDKRNNSSKLLYCHYKRQFERLIQDNKWITRHLTFKKDSKQSIEDFLKETADFLWFIHKHKQEKFNEYIDAELNHPTQDDIDVRTYLNKCTRYNLVQKFKS